MSDEVQQPPIPDEQPLEQQQLTLDPSMTDSFAQDQDDSGPPPMTNSSSVGVVGNEPDPDPDLDQSAADQEAAETSWGTRFQFQSPPNN